MDKPDYYQDENTSRLIEAGFGSEARPGRELRAALFARLRATLKARREPVTFPERGVVLLLAVVVALAALLAVHGAEGLGAVAALVLAGNLATVPIAALTIVVRRRKCITD